MALSCALALAGCDKLMQPKVVLDSDYQAVFMTGGQVFFGRLEGAGSPYPVLREVYYVQNQVNPETKQSTTVLLRRGKEWHGPRSMVLNAQHILMIESVSPDSKVAQLINQARQQGGN